jgi:hypothetical protein
VRCETIRVVWVVAKGPDKRSQWKPLTRLYFKLKKGRTSNFLQSPLLRKKNYCFSWMKNKKGSQNHIANTII